MSQPKTRIQQTDVHLDPDTGEVRITVLLVLSGSVKTITARGTNVPSVVSELAYKVVDELGNPAVGTEKAILAREAVIARADQSLLIGLDGVPLNWYSGTRLSVKDGRPVSPHK